MDDEMESSLRAFANRQIHSRLDSAILRAVPDAEVEQTIVDYVITKLDADPTREAEVVRTLSPGVRATYLTWLVEAEVNNGGFNQYYFNSAGKFASETVDAFEYFDATELAALMKEANAVRASEEAEMAKFSERGTLEAFSESYEHTRLGPLDARFLRLSENLSELRVARIRRTPEQFAGN